MSSIQKFFKTVFPASWAASMEAESRSWMMRCPCGFERSIWDIGGIRWKAKGTKKNYKLCPSCKELNWHTIEKRIG